jgi:hypothetical protein
MKFLLDNIVWVLIAVAIAAWFFWPRRRTPHQEVEEDAKTRLKEYYDSVKKKEDWIERIGKFSEEELDDVEKFRLLVAHENHGDLLQYASERLRGDRELVLTAVQYPSLRLAPMGRWDVPGPTGSPLEYASSQLRNDREVVLRAIEHSHLAFGFASSELRGDPEVIWAALNRYDEAGNSAAPIALKDISEVLFSNKWLFYKFLVDLHDGTYLNQDLHASGEYMGFLSHLGEHISQLLLDREVLERALDETEWASDYSPQE